MPTLNPVAAGIAAVPEESARAGSVAGSRPSMELEEALWLIPIEDRRQLDSQREGMLSGFALGNYLMLVEYTGRLLREGKAAISSELADIFERLGLLLQWSTFVTHDEPSFVTTKFNLQTRTGLAFGNQEQDFVTVAKFFLGQLESVMNELRMGLRCECCWIGD